MKRVYFHKPKEPKPWSRKKIRRVKVIGVFVLALLAVLFLIIFIQAVIDELRPRPPMILGASFSAPYAQSLGLDWRQTYTASLDELGVRLLRLPVYWNQIEPKQGEFYFEDIDWMLGEAALRDAKVLLAVGMRLPRWPECHIPDWAEDFSEEERQAAVLSMLRQVVDHYRGHPAILAWQVENEPLLELFGECPKPDRDFLKQEVALVKALDARPIVITESGELSTWLRTVRISDILGISMYRVSWNKWFGYIYYPLHPSFYRQRAEAVSALTRRVIVTELQAEPWVPKGILDTPLSEQFRSMDPERLKDNISFVKRADISEVYLWGIEWWYWLREAHNDPSMWDLGKQIFSESAPAPLIY